MVDIWEKASQHGDDRVSLVSDLEHRPAAELDRWELVHADDISDEGEFPQHGEFLAVHEDGDDQADVRFWECPRALAAKVMEAVDREGGPANVDPRAVRVDVDGASKTQTGEWRFWAEVSVDTEGAERP